MISTKARLIDFAILTPLIMEFFYVPYQLFVVLRPTGTPVGALGDLARNLPYEAMMVRRMYAMEFYVDLIALILYLAFRQKILEQFSQPISAKKSESK